MKSLQKLKNRRMPPEEARIWNFSKAKRAAVANESYEWLVEATQPIEVKYTNATFEQGDRVKSQLANNLNPKYICEFEYQGSVSSDTHVKYHSDIDLLVINGCYTSYPSNYQVANPVTNEEVVDSLMSLRKDTAIILSSKFPEAVVDQTGAKAVTINGGSLERDIDVVFCNWWNTQEYLGNKVKANRGIAVLNAPRERIFNKPFLHNWQIHNKDTKVGGGLRKSIRLLKTLKYDKEPEAAISSYDIAALSFCMDEADLNVAPGAYLKLARNTSAFLNSLVLDTNLRESLYVPNGTRKIFEAGGATLASLKEITAELDSLLADISTQESLLIEFYEFSQSHEKTASWKEARANRVQELANKFMQVE